MQIVFFGAGGIGGYFGGRLAASGARVAFLARGRHAQALQAQGLRIASPLGDLHLPQVTVAEAPADLPKADLVVFTVKLPDAEAAAAQLPAVMQPGTVVLPLQNGVDIAEMLARHVGAGAVAQGLAYIATRIAAPGHIEHGGDFARLRFGPLQAGQAATLQGFLDACRAAGIDAERPGDIRRAVWEKFVFLVGLSGLTALTRQPGVALSKQALIVLLDAVLKETLGSKLTKRTKPRAGLLAGLRTRLEHQRLLVLEVTTEQVSRPLQQASEGPQGCQRSRAEDIRDPNTEAIDRKPEISGRLLRRVELLVQLTELFATQSRQRPQHDVGGDLPFRAELLQLTNGDTHLLRDGLPHCRSLFADRAQFIALEDTRAESLFQLQHCC